jgi:CRISPR-associated protein Cas1
MAWRSVVIANPAQLKLKHHALLVEQESGSVNVPLEDIAVLIIDHPQITLTAQLLSACAGQQIAVITVDSSHTPNGVFLAYLPHSRALKVMRAQLALGLPARKRLWQWITQRKILNQAHLLTKQGHADASRHLHAMAAAVRSGDPDNFEAHAAQVYFRTLFGEEFIRAQNCFYNAALNYGYSILRSALARSLVSYGFLPAFGLHHRNEQNAFNLADDLIEPYRPLVDAHVLNHYPLEPNRELAPIDKSQLVNLLHLDVPRLEETGHAGSSTLLALIDATVVSLTQRLSDGGNHLTLPGMPIKHE